MSWYYNLVLLMRYSGFQVAVLCFLLGVVWARSPYKATSYKCTTTNCSFALTYTGTEDYYKTPKSPIIKNIVAEFKCLNYYDFNIKIYDPNNKRFEVPQGNGFPEDPSRNFSYPCQVSGYQFQYTLDPFDFRFARGDSNYTLFSTYDQDFVFSDHYLQFGTEIENDYIYGLGERFSSNLRVKNGKWTLFNRDHPFEIDYGTGQQTYGYYPYFLNKDQNSHFHLTYFRSSNAMDIIKEVVSGKTFLTFKVIGGIIDLRFFVGDMAKGVLNNMIDIAGQSNLPPFWSFGFHQCRWGYENSSMLLDVLANYQKHGIPLDTIWSDIDYMDDFEDFTIDQQNFPLSDMKKIMEKYRYIPIIDAGIKVGGIAYEEGLKRNVFINDALGKPFVGAVWPGDTTFVDFFHPNASSYWQDMLDILYKKVPFDGVWLDMNELSNFCNGPCSTPTTPTEFDYTNDLPYHPGNSKIEDGTIPLNSTHYFGYKEADVHNFNAFLQTKATNSFLKSKKVRPFIVSRSSTIGSSSYGNHWTGDNAATWEFLQGSIANILNSQINGFKIVGEDICGFGGNTTEELCARWFQLGSLYPFARSHNAYGASPQEPYAMGAVVLEAAKKSIKLRYSLLKHLYMYLFIDDTPFWSPLFYLDQGNAKLYTDQVADTTFYMSGVLLVAPILEEGKTSRSVYFPSMDWYDFYSGKRYQQDQTAVITCNLTDTVPMFIGEGYGVFTQNTDNVRNTDDLTNAPFIFNGALYYRDDESTTKIYRSTGYVPSFKDHNNQTNINRCYKGRGYCFYEIKVMLIVENNKKTLHIYSYERFTLVIAEEILIEKFNLFYKDGVINFKPKQPVSITNSGQVVVIEIDENQTDTAVSSPEVHLTTQ